MIEYKHYDCNTDNYYNSIGLEGEEVEEGQGIWVLTDGDKLNNKKSTNGTWLFVDELFPLSNELVFKAG